jgi:hypothetical protein
VNEDDRRRNRLRHAPGQILGTLDGEPIQILDVSLTGLGFETALPLESGRRYRFELYTEVGELTVVGSLAWCREVEVPGKAGTPFRVRRAGVRFGPLPHDEAALLERLVEHAARQGYAPTVEREEFTTEFAQEDVAELVRAKLRKREPG